MQISIWILIEICFFFIFFQHLIDMQNDSIFSL